MSDLVENHIVGLPRRRLIWEIPKGGDTDTSPVIKCDWMDISMIFCLAIANILYKICNLNDFEISVIFIKLLTCLSDCLELFLSVSSNMSRLVGKPTMWFPNGSDTNQAVQSHKQILELSRRGIVLSEKRKQRR